MRRADANIEFVSRLSKLPDRKKDGHKGTFGRVLVVGGSAGMIGAPVFAATAALRIGAGLVQIAVPKSILSNALVLTPELIGIDVAASRDLAEACQLADVLVVGPGLGSAATALNRVAKLLSLDKPIVLDADGLRALSSTAANYRSIRANLVMTPHPGEMARLMRFPEGELVPASRDGRIETALACAKKHAQVVVLKGHESIVTDGHRIYFNSTGNTSLAKAGTGDVLSGMIAGLMAQGLARFEAASLAVLLHGRAGEIAGRRLGERSVFASDVLIAISDAIAEYIKGKRSS